MSVSRTHERLLLDPIEAYFREVGFEVARPYATHRYGYAGLIDLFATRGSLRVVVEAEMTADRVPGDVAKAVAIGATHLLIVTPTRRVAEACERKATRSEIDTTGLAILSRPVGPLVAALTSFFPFPSGPVPAGRDTSPRTLPGDQSR